MLGIDFMDLLHRLPAVFIGFSFHEFAHALAADAMGDDTARLSGRLTLDPLVHIDPLGIIMLAVFRFGWAKPVPINPLNFKNRKKGMILVSLAGPMMNFIIALAALFIYAILYSKFGFINEIVDNILINIYLINIGLGVFNLIPLPPLDGSKILAGFLPARFEYKFYSYERYSYLLLLLLIFTDAIDTILGPMFFYAEMGISYVVGLFF
ncbi:site-2 protease family protein [Lutispora thermophila]|uniref:Site-2 protease family protein n=2 Tax=Lutispora saccharofermentans TaxID=3024236 RepID=A0ABT1NHR0_9FIRM|nr:site-2 protease family protein [Lutispora saccharofermentans]MCQ1529851.1 site-2 protease family protein [Lutispora saccharofermentans]